MSDLLIVSPCFYPDDAPAELMVKSAMEHGMRPKLYGVGEPFIPHGAHAQVLRLYEFMYQRSKLADYLLFTDCRDVLFLTEEREILEKFEASGSRLLMSAEQGCWPPDRELAEFFHGKDKNGYNYVNAGQYIGTWEQVYECNKFLLDHYRGSHPGADNSQGWWMWAKMRGELDFVLDSGCQVFQSMSGGAQDQLNWPHNATRLFNRCTQSSPCSLHFNGNPSNDAPQREMYRRLFGWSD